ncbi:MAG TPA: hypothetical protein VGO43_13665 [Pyrinomonadaceae bacterium]|jgi:hypothetical protein|nr:hypothetical protein [Pyrinomonadaceae bacterium]
MNLLTQFARKYHFSVRGLSELCGGSGDSRHPGISKNTIHRLIGDHPDAYPGPDYVHRIEPAIRDACRKYLVHTLGKSESDAASEVPDEGLLATPPQFTQEIHVPKGCSANYVFKDPTGKVLAVHAFAHI